MAKFLLNSSNLNSNNSFTIQGIRIDTNFVGDGSLDVPLSLINPNGDLNGDGNNDLFVQSSFFFADNSLNQENFIVFGSESIANTINLAELNGSNGFSLSNTIAFASGFSDINGDAIDDLLVTTTDVINQQTSTAVILGNSEFSTTFDLTSLDGNNGFTISDSSTNLINSAITGDVNNDNINDLIFFSSNATDDTTENATAIINKIVFGSTSYPANLDISVLDGSNGFTVEDTAIISGVGIDINQDDFDDLIFSDLNTPISYVVFGKSSFAADLDLALLAVGEGLIITEEGEGTSESDRFLSSLAEDINGDGIGDIIIQKSIVSESDDTGLISDGISVIYGRSENTTNTFNLANIDGSNGFSIDSAEILSIVDLNGDNLQDLVVKNPGENSQSFVIFGSNSLPANIDLNSLDGSNGFVISNTNLSAGAIGDVNGDSIDDLILDTEGDVSYLLLGSQEGFAATVDLTSVDANAIAITGTQTTNGVAGLSDLNGDDIDEIIFNSVIDEGDNTVASSTVVFGDSDLSFATDNSGENPPSEETIDLFRFRNTTFDTGTYVFVGEEEKNAILADEDLRNTFSLDGEQPDGTVNPAFKASLQPGENLIPFFRLKSEDVLGTFLFVSTGEYDAIFATDSDQRDKWEREGLDADGNDIPEFYLLDGSADLGIEFNRFQNNQNNTFLYAGPDETGAIESDPNLSSIFTNQGVAFESLT